METPNEKTVPEKTKQEKKDILAEVRKKALASFRIKRGMRITVKNAIYKCISEKPDGTVKMKLKGWQVQKGK